MTASELQKIFSKNIKRIRNERGLSQMKLAELSNVSTGFLCDIEREVKWGTPETFVKISKALNVLPFELLIPYENISTKNDDSIAIKRAKQKAAKEITDLVKKNISNSVQEYIASFN